MRWFSGFSLIELLAVLAIVGILSALALPSYPSSIRTIRRLDGQTALYHHARYAAAALSDPTTHTAFPVPGQRSPEGWYWIETSITAPTGYVIRATAQGAQQADTAYDPRSGQMVSCQVLTLTHTGSTEPRACWP